MKFNTGKTGSIRHLLSQKNVSFRSGEFVLTVQSHDTIFFGTFLVPKLTPDQKVIICYFLFSKNVMILMYQSRGCSMIIVQISTQSYNNN